MSLLELAAADVLVSLFLLWKLRGLWLPAVSDVNFYVLSSLLSLALSRMPLLANRSTMVALE